MHDRCNNRVPYIARGTRVCAEWDNYQRFKEWALSHGYQDNLTLERIDNNGNYCPENCKWATIKEQSNNKKNNHLLTHNGETHTISEWADKLHISLYTICGRARRGWPTEKILTTPSATKYWTGKEV
jgi:hypothetical protein